MLHGRDERVDGCRGNHRRIHVDAARMVLCATVRVQAGCEFEIGREKACPCQPMTMYALLVVKDVAQIADCMHGTGDGGRHVGPKAFQGTHKRAGVTPSYGHACLFPIQGNLVLLMANHEYGINATEAAQVTEATLRGRGGALRCTI